MNDRGRRAINGESLVALVLALGLVAALNSVTVAVLWDALFHSDPGLSANSTQVLLSTFGGIIGLLGGWIGGRASARHEGELRAEQQHHDALSVPERPDDPDAVRVTPER